MGTLDIPGSKQVKKGIFEPKYSLFWVERIQKKLNLAKTPNRELTLVLDLDETLVHSSKKANYPVGSAFQKGPKLNYSTRPFLEEFLDWASSHFEVIIFTAARKSYADPIIDHLDPFNTLVHHRLYREHCIKVPEGFIKDLRVLGRDLAKVVIVDDSPVSFSSNMENGLQIKRWRGDTEDKELLKLTEVLVELFRY